MGRFDGILICTDLDGTLYKNDKTVSRENREAIDYFKREGGYFTFITGRMPYYAQDAYNAVQPNVPFGCVNGGGLYDGEENRYVWKQEISKDVRELVRCIDEELPQVGIQVCCFDKTYFSKENDVMENFRRSTHVPNNIRHYQDIDEPVGKILFGSSKEEEIFAIEKILKAHPLADSFSFVRSEKTLFEILPKGVDKGLPLGKLVKHMNIDERKTFAIGDYDNDIGMLKTAAFGIAVANASKAALDAADHITVSNEENAIAQVIRDIENGKYEFGNRI